MKVPKKHLSADSDSAEFVTDFAIKCAAISELDDLCAFIAQQALLLVDADDAAVYLDTRPLAADDTSFQVATLLRLKDEELGVLILKRRSRGRDGTPQTMALTASAEFDDDDKGRLELLTSIASLAVARLKKEQSVRLGVSWRERALNLLQETGHAMASTLESAPLMRRIILAITQALNAESGMLALLDSSDHLVIRAVVGSMPTDVIGRQLDAEKSLIGWVVRRGQSATVHDASGDPRSSWEHEMINAVHAPLALLATVLVTKGQTIGAVELAGKRDGVFDEGDQHLLEAVSFSAAGAIKNVRLYEGLQRRAQQQENVIRVSSAVSSSYDVDAILQQVAESALSVIPSAFTAAVHLLDRDKGTLQFHCSAGQPLWEVMKQPFAPGEGIAGHAFSSQEVLNVPDVLNDTRYVSGSDPAVYRSILVAPLIVEDEALGTLSVNGLDLNAFGTSDEQMIRALAAQGAVALHSARLLNSLRKSEARHRHLVENVNALLITIDGSGKIVFAGGHWDAMLGYLPDELVGLSYQDLCQPDDWPMLAELSGNVFTTPSTIADVRYRALHKDGSIRWHQVSAVSVGDQEGQVREVHAVIQDVSAQVEAEQVISRHADQMSTLNAISSHLSRSLDVDDIVHRGMQTLTSVMNMDAAGLILLDADLRNLIPHVMVGVSADLLELRPDLQLALRSLVVGTRQPVIISDLKADRRLDGYPGLPETMGHEGLRTLAVTPVLFKDELLGVLFLGARAPNAIPAADLQLYETIAQQLGVALHNAHLYAEAEDRANELEVAYRQMQDLARRKTQFVQNTSHELRTPLTIVRGYLEMLQERGFGPLSEEQQHVVQLLNTKCQHLIDLVHDIGSLIEVDMRPEDLTSVDLAEIVARSAAALSEKFDEAGVFVEFRRPRTPIIVSGDQYRLTQVFYHLLDNAIKFSPEGGRVELGLWAETDSAVVRVTDQGIGISADEQEPIFDRFYQADGSTTRRFSGTGLGLAIVKETVEAHGGTVTVESNSAEGTGTTFIVVLPLADQGIAGK